MTCQEHKDTLLELAERDRRKLQAIIDRTVKAATAFCRTNAELNDWCIARYGVEPSGMTAIEFDKTMREATNDQTR